MNESEVIVSWDMFSVVGEIVNDPTGTHEEDLISRLISNYNTEDFMVEHVSGTGLAYYVLKAYRFKSEYDEIGAKNVILRDNVMVYIEKVKYRRDLSTRIRVEFNPNKLIEPARLLLKDLLGYLQFKTVSRADLAFDIRTDLSTYSILANNATSVAYYNRSGMKETQYYGRRGSDQQIRMYDKRAQLLKNKEFNDYSLDELEKPWWRLEFQMRRKLSQDFEQVALKSIRSLYTLSDIDFENMKPLDYMVLIALCEHKELWGKLTKYQRRKYRQLLRENVTNSELVHSLEQCLANEQPRLLAELNNVVYDVES